MSDFTTITPIFAVLDHASSAVLDLSDYPYSMYFLEIYTTKGVALKKVIKR